MKITAFIRLTENNHLEGQKFYDAISKLRNKLESKKLDFTLDEDDHGMFMELSDNRSEAFVREMLTKFNIRFY